MDSGADQPNTSAKTWPHETGDEPVGLVCKEIWGGNRAFYGPVELPGMHGVLFSQPCAAARGGDVHYLSVCGSGLISRACLADVTGHGESVSAVGQSMHDLLRRSANRMDERKVLRRMNLRLFGLDEKSYTTAVVFTYFPPTRRLSLSYAGHEPAWYWSRAAGSWSQLEPRGQDKLSDIPLAVEKSARYSARVQRVAVGDRLLLMTDGVLEAPNEAGELFGRERLRQALRAGPDDPPAIAVRGILAALQEHAGGGDLRHDDVSLLMVEFVDNLKGPMLWTMLKNRVFRRARRRSVKR